MATIVNDRDVLLQAAGTRLETVSAPSNWTTQWSQVLGTGRPDDYADVTEDEINTTVLVTGGGLTLSAGGAIKGGQTAYATGTGFFLGYSSGLYRFSIGTAGSLAADRFLRWTGSNLALQADISGSGSIDMSGSAKFDGSGSVGAYSAAIGSNVSRNADVGVYAYSGSGSSKFAFFADVASGTNSGYRVNIGNANGIGFSGNADSSSGRAANFSGSTSSGSIALQVSHSIAGGVSLKISSGIVEWNGYTIALPSGGTTKFLRNDGAWSDLTSLLTLVTTAASATGGAATLPANPVGFLRINTYGGAGEVRIPYYS